MPRTLTNKQQVVLHLLQRTGGEMTANEISDVVTAETPCSACDGREPEERVSRYSYERHTHEEVCAKCNGRRTAYFGYSAAYQALKRLCTVGVISRRSKLDEWGDEVGIFVYKAVATEPDPNDPLEQAWRMSLPGAAPSSASSGRDQPRPGRDPGHPAGPSTPPTPPRSPQLHD